MKKIIKVISIILLVVSLSTMFGCSSISGTYEYVAEENVKQEVKFGLNQITFTFTVDGGEISQYKCKYKIKEDKIIISGKDDGQLFVEVWEFEKGEDFVILEGVKYTLK